MKIPETVISLDWETYYADDYTLSKMTTESYIRDPRFETIGVGVSVNGDKAWLEHHEFVHWAKQVDWSNVTLLAHHMHFDGAIAAWHYGIVPAFYLCTLCVARLFMPADVGGSLKRVAQFLHLGEKGEEVILAKNKRRSDFSPEEYARYGQYCLNDVDLCEGIATKLVPLVPEDELILMDMTIRAFTEPMFNIDVPLTERFITYEQKRKADLLERVLKDKSQLMSNDKFAQLLIEMGEDPPMKVSPAKTKQALKKAVEEGRDPRLVRPVETYAFAKTDIGMQQLLENEREDIRWLAEARVGVKSTINETRAQRFRGMGLRGPAAIYLKYAGAHTYRFSGADKTNFQNMQRGCPEHAALDWDCTDCAKGVLRMSLFAPSDDASQLPEAWVPQAVNV